MNTNGFLRVAAASPELRVADCPFNADRTLALMARAEKEGVNLLVFPECGLTGYTCHDLFHMTALQRAAENALERVVKEGEKLVIGGIILDNRSRTLRGVPVMSRIPIVGWLFKSQESASDGEELVVIITPSVVAAGKTAAR